MNKFQRITWRYTILIALLLLAIVCVGVDVVFTLF
jgi:hypothetical protein